MRWYNSQKELSSNLRELLKERLDKTNSNRKLPAKESKRLSKLKTIGDKLKYGEKLKLCLVFNFQYVQKKIKFHPSQHLVWQKDNSSKMYFKCKDWKELIHELFHPCWQGG